MRGCVGHRQVRYLIVWNPVIVGVSNTGVSVFNTSGSVFYPRARVSSTGVSVPDTGVGVSDTGRCGRERVLY